MTSFNLGALNYLLNNSPGDGRTAFVFPAFNLRNKLVHLDIHLLVGLTKWQAHRVPDLS